MQLHESHVLAFAPAHNSHGKRDATGAFIPHATKFVKAARKGRVVLIDNRKPFAQRRKAVLAALEEERIKGLDVTQLDAVAFFCHGWIDGIQLGFRRRNAKTLATALHEVTAHDFFVVPLYCCSTGDDPDDDPLNAAGTGDDSFADKLRDHLCAAGTIYNRVMGHTTVAHTTNNPFVVFFDGMGTPDGGVGGYAPVKQGSANWPAWRRALRDRDDDLRYRFPFMTVGEIHAELVK